MPPHDAALPPRPVRCPICGRPAEREHRPFCSRRCRDIDLGRWLNGSYRIETDDDDDDRADDPSDRC